LLNGIFDTGLAHICRIGGVDEAWWQTLLDKLAQPYVAPDFLRIPAVQEWLAQAQVRADIKAIARAIILGNAVDESDIRARLAESYSGATGETPALANGPIDVAVAIVAASVLARLSSEGQAIGGMIQASGQEIQSAKQELKAQIATLNEKVDHIRLPGPAPPLTDECASRDLQRILRRRGIDLKSDRTEIQELALRVREGDLQSVSQGVRADVFYWAARLHAVYPETLNIAQAYRDDLRELAPRYDIRLIDGLLAKARGDIDESLQTVRNVETPDGRSVLFGLLCDIRGRSAALLWLTDYLPFGPDLLTGYGWRAAIVKLAEEKRWEEAARIASTTTRDHLKECPDLAYVNGAINAGLLLPTDFRHCVLQGPIALHIGVAEGREADERRERAGEQFGVAARLMDEIGFPQRAEAAREWLLCLRLIHPDLAVRESARQEVHLAMRNGREAVDRVALAIAFGVEFEPEPLERFLRERALTGGLDDREWMARLRLIEAKHSRRELIQFIGQEEQALIRAIPPDVVIGKMAEALVKEGEVARAEQVLDEHKTCFDPDDLQRLRFLISEARGEPVRQRLEQLYARTANLMDLRNLITHLVHSGDWSAARPLLEELFRHEHTVENAYRVLRAMEQEAGRDDNAILRFMESNEDLVTKNQDLQALKAWVLFRLGRLTESKVLNDVLVGKRKSSDDLALDVNIAVRSGDWGHFAVIIEREWPQRYTHDPRTLLRLAAIAAESGDVRRGTELARLAAEKAPDQAQVLMAAYTLSVQLGREGRDVAAWLERAASLSSSGGPVHRFHIRQLVEEFMPAQAERVRNVNNLVTQGKVPIHAAAAMLHMPLARILIELPLRNASIQDGRQLTAIPIVSGARHPLRADSSWTLGMDITSLMVLSNVGLLQKALNAFRRILLPPSTLEFMLNERRDARFHQPSRIDAANELHGLFDSGGLKVLDSAAVPRVEAGLAEQVGRELAELLQVAHQRGGVVIHPKPIYRPSTYLEEEADLGEYQGAVLSPSALVEALRQAGFLDQKACVAALSYLRTAEPLSDTAAAPAVVLGGAIYLDRLAVTYLQTAGALAALASGVPHVFVHPSLRDDVHALLRESQNRIKLEERIDDIRVVLNHAIASGQAVLPPQSQRTRDDEDQILAGTTTLMHFVKNSSGCDAVCIDDRCANRYLHLADESGRSIPLLCALDVIQHLQTQGVITRNELLAALYTLRRQGFMLIPTSRDELDEIIRASIRSGGEGELAESAELRAIRIGVLRARTLEMVRQPMETPYLDNLRHQCVQVLFDLWRDESISIEEASKASDWIWRKLFPSPVDWRCTIEDPEVVVPPILALVNLLAAILQLTPAIKEERGKAFRAWVESSLVEPLLPANAEVVDDIANSLESGLERIVEELGHDII
jgi:hypothetical protein